MYDVSFKTFSPSGQQLELEGGFGEGICESHTVGFGAFLRKDDPSHHDPCPVDGCTRMLPSPSSVSGEASATSLSP